jgi:hypothetical protein
MPRRLTIARTIAYRQPAALAVVLAATLAAAAHAAQQSPPPASTSPATPPAAEPRENPMTSASGTFDVDVTPITGEQAAPGSFPRHSLAKRFHGDLEGTSAGEMMSVDAAVEGSGAYVAIERVTGKLHGRSGGFSLVHRGTMRRGGDFRLAVDVVPDSGTGELAGIAGTMEIRIGGGEHRYELSYTLPAAP